VNEIAISCWSTGAILLVLRFTLLVGFPAMNSGPIIWGLVGAVGVLALRGILTKLQNGNPILPKFGGADADEEYALIVTITLRSGGMGDRTERERIIALEHELSDAIENSSAGELDGDEYGGGTCTIYMYASDAERLLSVTLPILKRFHAPQGSYVVARHGNSNEKEHRIPIDGGSPTSSGDKC
jgi:hypothetical protein